MVWQYSNGVEKYLDSLLPPPLPHQPKQSKKTPPQEKKSANVTRNLNLALVIFCYYYPLKLHPKKN